jgi:hypothetical protein
MATIEAAIKRVYQDERDWYHIETDHPSVDDLRTKQVAKAREAKSFADSGETLLIEYKHQQRPKEGGGFWDNYYFESARTANASTNGGGGSEIERVAPTASSSGATTTGSIEKEWRIALAVGVKMVGSELPVGHLTDLTFGGLSKRALAWATFLSVTPQPSAVGELPEDDEIPF